MENFPLSEVSLYVKNIEDSRKEWRLMRKLDVLLMILSFLFPIVGILGQISLQLSLFIGGLLFCTSLGSYYTKKTNSRIFSWITYTIFITFLLMIRDQYATTSSLLAHAKIAACVAIIPLVFRFRTYAITVGLLSLWGMLLWDIKEIQSLTVLQRMMNLFSTEKLYLLILVGGFLLGGLLGSTRNRENGNGKQKSPSGFKQKKKRMRPTFKIRLPRLPKLKLKMLKRRGNSSEVKETRSYEQSHKEIASTYENEKQEATSGQGKTRIERRRNRYKR